MRDDLYATLGVVPDASRSAIQAAFRELARRWHPDRNDSEDAVAQFAAISNAYAVLGSDTRRAAYDRTAQVRGADRPPPARARPIHCSECGAATAMPRILVFRMSVGLGVWSHVRRTEGVFCSRCARRAGIEASLWTAVMGWWAIPFGPLVSAWCIWSNARGGSRRAKVDRRLVLVNAQVFFEQDNLKLANALARRALEGADRDDAETAEAIIQRVKLRGLDGRQVVIKDPWRFDFSYAALHMVLLLAPIALMIAIGFAFVGN